MKLLPLKFLTVFVILLFSLEICRGQMSHGNIELSESTFTRYSENESPGKNCVNLEWKESESRPTNHADKVETIIIIRPASKYSEVRLINLFTLQKIVFSKKNYSSISHYYILILKILQISPLVNILRI